MFGNILGMAGGCDRALPNPLNLETSLTLSLLNLRTIGSLNDVRPFNLQQAIADSERTAREMQQACEVAKQEQMNARIIASLESLGWALQGYASENDGVLPKIDSPAAAKEALESFVGDSSAFVHPVTSEPYQPNPTLSGKKLAEIPNPNDTIAFYEATPAADGSRGVVYLDGVARRIAAADWAGVKQNSGLP
jgi:hypothetical protein